MYKRMTYLRMTKLLAGMDGVNVSKECHVTIMMRDDDVDWERITALAEAASDKLNEVLCGVAYRVCNLCDANEQAIGLQLVKYVPYEPHPYLTGYADPMHY